MFAGETSSEGGRHRRKITRRMRGRTVGGDEEEDAEDHIAYGQRSLVAFLLEEGAALAAERCWLRKRAARKRAVQWLHFASAPLGGDEMDPFAFSDYEANANMDAMLLGGFTGGGNGVGYGGGFSLFGEAVGREGGAVIADDHTHEGDGDEAPAVSPPIAGNSEVGGNGNDGTMDEDDAEMIERHLDNLGVPLLGGSFDAQRRSGPASSDSSSSAPSECSAVSSVSSASSTSCWSSCDEACGDREEARRREARAAVWVARAADADAARAVRRKARAERGRRWPRPQTLTDETLIAAIDRYVAAATGGACACGAADPCACPAVAEYLSALHQPSAVPPGAADTNAVDEAEGLAPLHAACLYHSPSVIAHLLSRGADPGVPAGEGAVARRVAHPSAPAPSPAAFRASACAGWYPLELLLFRRRCRELPCGMLVRLIDCFAGATSTTADDKAVPSNEADKINNAALLVMSEDDDDDDDDDEEDLNDSISAREGCDGANLLISVTARRPFSLSLVGPRRERLRITTSAYRDSPIVRRHLYNKGAPASEEGLRRFVTRSSRHRPRASASGTESFYPLSSNGVPWRVVHRVFTAAFSPDGGRLRFSPSPFLAQTKPRRNTTTSSNNEAPPRVAIVDLGEGRRFGAEVLPVKEDSKTNGNIGVTRPLTRSDERARLRSLHGWASGAASASAPGAALLAAVCCTYPLLASYVVRNGAFTNSLAIDMHISPRCDSPLLSSSSEADAPMDFLGLSHFTDGAMPQEVPLTWVPSIPTSLLTIALEGAAAGVLRGLAAVLDTVDAFAAGGHDFGVEFAYDWWVQRQKAAASAARLADGADGDVLTAAFDGTIPGFGPRSTSCLHTAAAHLEPEVLLTILAYMHRGLTAEGPAAADNDNAVPQPSCFAGGASPAPIQYTVGAECLRSPPNGAARLGLWGSGGGAASVSASAAGAALAAGRVFPPVASPLVQFLLNPSLNLRLADLRWQLWSARDWLRWIEARPTDGGFGPPMHVFRLQDPEDGRMPVDGGAVTVPKTPLERARLSASRAAMAYESLLALLREIVAALVAAGGSSAAVPSRHSRHSLLWRRDVVMVPTFSSVEATSGDTPPMPFSGGSRFTKDAFFPPRLRGCGAGAGVGAASMAAVEEKSYSGGGGYGGCEESSSLHAELHDKNGRKSPSGVPYRQYTLYGLHGAIPLFIGLAEDTNALAVMLPLLLERGVAVTEAEASSERVGCPPSSAPPEGDEASSACTTSAPTCCFGSSGSSNDEFVIEEAIRYRIECGAGGFLDHDMGPGMEADDTSGDEEDGDGDGEGNEDGRGRRRAKECTPANSSFLRVLELLFEKGLCTPDGLFWYLLDFAELYSRGRDQTMLDERSMLLSAALPYLSPASAKKEEDEEEGRRINRAWDRRALCLRAPAALNRYGTVLRYLVPLCGDGDGAEIRRARRCLQFAMGPTPPNIPRGVHDAGARGDDGARGRYAPVVFPLRREVVAVNAGESYAIGQDAGVVLGHATFAV